MLFTQLEFPIFFLVVLAAAWICTRRETRNLWLLAASYYFYAYWDYRFCFLLLLSTLVDYWVALWMYRSDSDRARRVLMMASVVVNLGVLGFFKYFNFFVDSARPLLEALGLHTGTLQIILPVGISFYTFQTLSYTIDVYRRRIDPVDRFLDFALYVAFFPQLVAGPIVRARELLPQLAVMPHWSTRRFYAGAQQMLRGAVKKVILADRMGEAVDVVFAGPDLYSGPTIAIAVLAYAGQIYYDFSGYSDIAIGSAKMLGYRFPINFRHPYLAVSMAEFWHRWHMTLSRWLRDYLYISLGGNRTSAIGTYRNLMITMTLGGLWHGAAWTFVIWGVWHGVALAAQRGFRDYLHHRNPQPSQYSLLRGSTVLSRFAGWAGTMSVVLVGWILFRSSGMDHALMILRRITTMAEGIHWYPPLAIAAILCMVAEHAAWRTRVRRAMRLPYDAWYSPIATTMLIWTLLLYAPRGFRPFVYFQF